MPSVETASAILESLDALGVTHVLYCPGSRSAPFAYALEAGSFGGDARAVLDERGAGFAAVGLARTGALPAIVVTSGTAVAELAPAVLEASHARLPLLVLSADRPGELRGVGASQATDQAGFFGTHVRASIDLEPQERLAFPRWAPDARGRGRLRSSEWNARPRAGQCRLPRSADPSVPPPPRGTRPGRRSSLARPGCCDPSRRRSAGRTWLALPSPG